MSIIPASEDGEFPAKVALGEVFPITASVFQEGKIPSSARVIIEDSKGKKIVKSMRLANPGRDMFSAALQLPKIGSYTFYIEGWADLYLDYLAVAEAKIPAGVDLELVYLEGIKLFTTLSKKKQYTGAQVQEFKKVIDALQNNKLGPAAKLKAISAPEILEITKVNPYQCRFSKSKKYPLICSRKLSLFSAWYQFFPRSEGAKTLPNGKIQTGTFYTATKRLKDIKKMGFDIIYIPPIHPIGFTNRKGKNNSLEAGITDPGSPWAVGSSEGGHDTVFSELGGEEGFEYFVYECKKVGLEVSIDLALQCSPDHPWVKKHPNWFKVQADGTIQFAENPPKKYQDIYPMYFDNDFEGIVNEVEKIMRKYIKLGVTIFRVDNPHTKPLRFWDRVIGDIKAKRPDILFLAEAFTKPPMMKALGYAGYDQSHCYFLWRDTRKELMKYIVETTSNDGYFVRPTFWPTTPDNLTSVLVKGGTVAHKIRAVLAATGSTSYGIYAGYELVENEWDVKKKEQADNEKYELKVRDWSQLEKYGVSDLLTNLNKIRNKHIAFQAMHNVAKLETNSEKVIAFSRHIDPEFTENGKGDDVIVIVNLDYEIGGKNNSPRKFKLKLKPKNIKAVRNISDLPEVIKATDELTGEKYELGLETEFTLDPKKQVALILSCKL